MKPIYKLLEDVKDAIAEYDKSDDHIPHGAGSNCIRCRLRAVITHSDEPSPGWSRAQRVRKKTVLGTAKSSTHVHELVRDRICREAVEVMYVLALDGTSRVTALFEVSRGGLHGCSVSAVDILRAVICARSGAFVLVHNHPSGDPSPSSDDVVMTRCVAEASKAVGVEFLDHVIVGGWDKHASLLDLGLMGD